MLVRFMCNREHKKGRPRTQAPYSTLVPRLGNDLGLGWPRVSQILGDNKKISEGLGLSLFC